MYTQSVLVWLWTDHLDHVGSNMDRSWVHPWVGLELCNNNNNHHHHHEISIAPILQGNWPPAHNNNGYTARYLAAAQCIVIGPV